MSVPEFLDLSGDKPLPLAELREWCKTASTEDIKLVLEIVWLEYDLATSELPPAPIQ